MGWDPAQYLTFADQRTRPALDLLARVRLAAPGRIVDLGCGPGNATALLAARWPDAALTGIDSDPAMLERARASEVRASWQQADIAEWQAAAPVDLLFSNACLQWLPDHGRLLPRLVEQLAPGGMLAVQMPANFVAPSHALMRALAAEPPFAQALAGVLRAEPVHAPEWYYGCLAGRAATLDLWTTEYLQALTGPDPVLRWVRSTALRPVKDALDAASFARFEAAYAERLRAAYPARPDGVTLFPFRRLFLVARRPA